jgi:hypothetical protein
MQENVKIEECVRTNKVSLKVTNATKKELNQELLTSLTSDHR